MLQRWFSKTTAPAMDPINEPSGGGDRLSRIDEAEEAIEEDDIPSITANPSDGAGTSQTSVAVNGGESFSVRKILSNKPSLPVNVSYGDEAAAGGGRRERHQADGVDDDDDDSDDVQQQDRYHPPEDIFALLFTTPFSFRSHAFLYSIFFFLFQFTIIALMTFDLLSDGTDYNPLGVPPAVDVAVATSQVLALFIAVITRDDVTDVLYLISVGYSPEAMPKTASKAKWVLSNLLRAILGFAIVFLCFVFIVQSTEVIELFKDFAAVVFVAEIDDVAFHLARLGFVSDELREATRVLEDISFPESRKDTVKVSAGLTAPAGHGGERKRCFSRVLVLRVRLRQIILLAFFGIMVGFWGRIHSRQANGDFITSAVDVQFGDEAYGTLRYAFFTGTYELRKGEIVNGRPVYYERGHASEGASGKFFYCAEEGAWVFTIAGFAKGEGRRDPCNWLLRSPDSKGFDLSAEPSSGWKVWTGTVEDASNFMLVGADCNGESDCNYHGSCESGGQCECDSGWFGSYCQFEDICDTLVLYIRDKPLVELKLLLDDDGEPILVYHRPVYYHFDVENEGIGVILFTGRRWFYTRWDEDGSSITELRSLLSQPFFHAHWSQIYEKRTVAFSKPTKSSMPVGEGIVWDVVGSARARGDFGQFGFWANIQFVMMHCKDVDCTVPMVCGNAGDCKNGTCICKDGQTGHFCQYPFETDIPDANSSLWNSEL